MFCLVLHSHLPWLANHGRWPVGEEWLYQSWAATHLPVARVLRTLAAEGRTRLLRLCTTPVLAAQLDDPHCLARDASLAGQLAAARPRGRRHARTEAHRRPRRHASTEARPSRRR